MNFIRINCLGCLNSFRQPDFHTYHKTLFLPPKTTVGGMIGSALGISPQEVNERWLKCDHFKMGIVGDNNGRADDLWQIRKYESKQISAFKKGIERQPYKTAVIVRELLYQTKFSIYLHFHHSEDEVLVHNALYNPVWALSLGREDELIKITGVEKIVLSEKEDVSFSHTILPFDINKYQYEIELNSFLPGNNILSKAPQIVKLPTCFNYNKDTDAREAIAFATYTFVFDLPVKVPDIKGFFDSKLNHTFQIF